MEEDEDEADWLDLPFDQQAIAAVTDLYRRFFPPDGAILDLTTGLVSHLPPEAAYSRVVGVGADDCELAENPFLDEWLVQDLNLDPRLPFADATFDGATICASVACLTRPVEVFREVGRVLQPNAALVITVAGICSQPKALACWRMLEPDGHLHLVRHYLEAAGNWSELECCHSCPTECSDPLYAVIARSRGRAY
jgi:SAM-dependent methyltransferase